MAKNATHSKQYFKVKTKLQKCYQRVTAIQNDLLHKFTTMIYQTYDTVVIEDLDVQAMQMQKKLKICIVHYLVVFVSIWNIKPLNSIKHSS